MSVEAVPGEADGTPAPIKLVHARAAPSICPLKDALSLDVGFSCSRDISQAHWNVTLVIDAALLQHEISLGALGPVDYQQGSSLFQFEAEGLDCSGIPESNVLNVGLITAVLKDAQGAQLAKVVWLTQVSKEGGIFMRTITDPAIVD